MNNAISKDIIFNALKQVIDPEIGINLVDLGMIKDIEIKDEEIIVKMVLTSPFCPMIDYLAEQVKNKVESVAPDTRVIVSMLDEPWVAPEGLRNDI
jgi:serine O-acetyltransferase